jgi:hypothetical protein
MNHAVIERSENWVKPENRTHSGVFMHITENGRLIVGGGQNGHSCRQPGNRRHASPAVAAGWRTTQEVSAAVRRGKPDYHVLNGTQGETE